MGELFRAAFPVILASAFLAACGQPAPLDAAVAPSCRSGAASCQPWERAWQQPPAVGTTVTSTGKILSPR